MPRLSFVVFLVPLIGWGVACQKNSSSIREPAAQIVPEAVPLDGGFTQPEAPKAESTPILPTTPEPVEPTVPGAPDSPAVPDPVIPTPIVPPSDTPVEDPPEPLPPAPTELRIKESQFWIYSKKEGQLSFNTPWDEEEGDGIIRDESAVPIYAKNCLDAARSTYNSLAARKDWQTRLQPLLEKRVTPELTFIIVTTDSESDRNALRRLDRDAYFWHWTDPVKKPVLSLNDYEKGSWVWEVIATPKTCVQPVVREIGRMFDWTSRRLTEKAGN